jgi:hypothetical protein
MFSLAARAGTRESIRDALERSARGEGEDAVLAAELLSDETRLRDFIRGASVSAVAAPASQRLSAVLGQLGLSVYLAPPSSAYIVGDIGFARAAVSDRSAATGSLVFIPVAPDVSIGFSFAAGKVNVRELSKGDIRRMNVAMTAQSEMIAGNNAHLVRVLSKVPLTGIPAFNK